MRSLTASQAYRRSASHRSTREQEADVFRHVNAGLRRAENADPLTRARAIADNERLWITIMDVLRDPANRLELALRSNLLSVGMTVRRELARPEPDLAFLININEQLAAGLSAL